MRWQQRRRSDVGRNIRLRVEPIRLTSRSWSWFVRTTSRAYHRQSSSTSERIVPGRRVSMSGFKTESADARIAVLRWLLVETGSPRCSVQGGGTGGRYTAVGNPGGGGGGGIDEPLGPIPDGGPDIVLRADLDTGSPLTSVCDLRKGGGRWYHDLVL